MSGNQPRHTLVISTDLECSTCTADCPACAESGNQPEKGAKGVEICAAISCNNRRDNWSPYCSEHTVSATRATPEVVTGVAPQTTTMGVIGVSPDNPERVRKNIERLFPTAPAPQPMSAEVFWRSTGEENNETWGGINTQPGGFEFAEAYAAHQHAELERWLNDAATVLRSDLDSVGKAAAALIAERDAINQGKFRALNRLHETMGRAESALRRLQGGDYRKLAIDIVGEVFHSDPLLYCPNEVKKVESILREALPAPPTAEPVKEGK